MIPLFPVDEINGESKIKNHIIAYLSDTNRNERVRPMFHEFVKVYPFSSKFSF